MKYRTRASTGTSVSNLALATMGFGTETDEAEAFAILDRFVEADGNVIDSANGVMDTCSQHYDDGQEPSGLAHPDVPDVDHDHSQAVQRVEQHRQQQADLEQPHRCAAVQHVDLVVERWRDGVEGDIDDVQAVSRKMPMPLIRWA